MSSNKTSKPGEAGTDGTQPCATQARDTTLDQIMTVYLLVVVTLSGSWVLGCMGYSFIWVFLLSSALFVVWKTKLTNIVRRKLEFEEGKLHRKRALKQSETVEWLNFVLNRWWVFNAETIEDLIKKRIDERLIIVKTPVVDNIELVTFTFGDYTPTIKHISAFEYADGIPGGRKPISWTNINKPPVGLDKLSSYQIVLEMDVASVCEDFKMIFRSTLGSGKASLSFDAAVEELSISGTLQVVLHMSMDTPFPHISKASISFTQLPDVWFNVKILKTLHLMEVPVVKSWIHTHVMEGITKALVDPGKIDIPLSLTGAVQMRHPGKAKPKQLAQGVLTIHIRGSPVTDKTDADDVRYTMLRIGDKKRQTPDALAIEQWEDVCSFVIYNLAKEKLNIKSKCRRLLTNVTLEYHCLELASFPLAVEKNVTTTVKMKDGSELELKFQYTPLPVIDLEYNFVTKANDVTDVSGVLYVCVHGARNVIASDRGGTSDPYCVLFCDRRRVMTTPFVPRTLNPTWNSVAEFFVGDFTKCNLSFYVYDWDGTNIIDDDFLGAAHLSLKEEEPSVVKKCLLLGCNKPGLGYVADLAYGQIIISVVFRPVSSVFKSERFRHASIGNSNRDYLYREDLVSPASKPHQTRLSSSISADHQGGGPHSPIVKKTSLAGEILEDKIFVDFTILQAKDLVGMDRNGLSDPYCEVLIENEKLFKTSVKKNTLFPKWNESFSFEVIDDTKLIDINVYDKDIISKDFLGKVVLSMDKLKEISHKGKSEWLSLQRTKSGKLQIKCTVTSKDTIEKASIKKTVKEKEYSVMQNSTKSDDVFLPNSQNDSVIKAEKAEKQKSAPLPLQQSSQNALIPPASHNPSVSMPFFEEPSKQPPSNGTHGSSMTNEVQSNSQKPKSGDSSLRRSASDVNINKRNGTDMEGYSTLPRGSRSLRHADSSNSFAAIRSGPDNVSTVPNDQPQPLDDSVMSDVTPDGSISGDKFYSVSGKVSKIRGLRTPETKFYCKVRLEEPSHGHRLRLFSSHHSRVIAKSSVQEATDPIVNLAFEVDRGAGVNTGASLIFDIKQDSKEHLAENTFCLKDLLDEHSDEPVQRWIKLSNGVDIEIELRRGSPNPRLAHKKSPGRFFKSLSFRKERVH